MRHYNTWIAEVKSNMWIIGRNAGNLNHTLVLKCVSRDI